MSLKSRFLKPGDFTEDRKDTDTEGQSNIITFNPHIKQTIDIQRQRLPVFLVRNHLLYLAENFQTILISGDTGCGKSTQVPQYLLESNWGEDGIIGVVEPRRVAATSLASRVAEEKSCILGEEIGYSIRFDDCSTSKTKIKYMTEGILIREMLADPLLRQYCVIMLDEVHERTLFTDIILGLLKKIMKKRKALRLLVCSATLDSNYFFNYLNLNESNDSSKDTVAILPIKGKTYPVDIFHLNEPTPDYVKGCVETVLKIHKSQAPGDILVFLTGAEEVDSCVDMLNEQARDSGKMQSSMSVMPMHGSLSNRAQLQVFLSTPPSVRKVVIATNLAETSITIPEIVYVIDSGFVKMRFYNAETHTDSLFVVPISKSSAIQRAGRCGRTRSGKVYRLYSEKEFEKFTEVTPPEMMRTNLSSAVLNLLVLGIRNILHFDFPSPPPSKHFIAALEELIALDAMDHNGKLTNPLGKRMAEIPLDPMLAKVLLSSEKYECSEEILSIIAMLQVENIFLSPHEKRMQSRIMHRKFQVKEGDLLTLLNVYTAFMESGESKKWCLQNYINYRGMMRTKELRRRMEQMLTKFDIKIQSSEGDIDPVCRCITAGLFPNAAYLHHSGTYRMIRGDQEIHIHPSSVLFYEVQPSWVVFNEVIHTNQVYMRDITVVEKNWLTEIAPHFYKTGTASHSLF